MNCLLYNFLYTLLFASLIAITSGNPKCSNESPLIVPKYYLMEKCHRSKLSVMAKANYTSLSSCQRLGIEKKALAFNFVPLEALKEIERERKKKRGKDNGTEPLEPIAYTCEVLKCAEVDGGLSLVNDSRYDYYSLYAKPFPHVNATCIPATGMFFLTPYKLNYTQARAACRNMSGVLADVVSEARTEALAQMLTGASTEAALVALRRSNGSSFYGANGNYMSDAFTDVVSGARGADRCEDSGCVSGATEEQWEFVFRANGNYMSGAVTNVVSEAEPEALIGARTQTVLVVLRRSSGSSLDLSGDPLDCSTYRAWAPGHPRRVRQKFDCVVVTGQRTWRSTPCKQRYSALCELNPGGPYKRGSIFASLKPINNTEAGLQNED